MEEKSQTTPFPLRMPDAVRQSITELAKASGRSMNAEIIQRLESSLAADIKAKAVLNGDPEMGIVTLCEQMVHMSTAIAGLVLESRIKSGKVKVVDDDQPE